MNKNNKKTNKVDFQSISDSYKLTISKDYLGGIDSDTDLRLVKIGNYLVLYILIRYEILDELTGYSTGKIDPECDAFEYVTHIKYKEPMEETVWELIAKDGVMNSIVNTYYGSSSNYKESYKRLGIPNIVYRYPELANKENSETENSKNKFGVDKKYGLYLKYDETEFYSKGTM